MDQVTIRPSQIYLPKEKDGTQAAPKFDPQGVVTLVVQDYNAAVSYVDEQEWFGQWRDNDLLYQSPLIPDSGDPTKARVSRFTVNNDVNTMGDAVKSGMFAQNPPFFLRKRGKTSQAELDGWMALLSALADRMRFAYWAGLGIASQTNQGTGIMKAGWSTRTRVKYKRKQAAQPTQIPNPTGNTETVHTVDSDEHNLVPVKVTESYPWVEYRMLGTTIFDPGWRTPNAVEYAGYAIDIDYPTWYNLADLAKDANYDIPDLDDLKDWLCRRGKYNAPQGTSLESGLSNSGSPTQKAADRSQSTSVDPLRQPIMMLTRSDADTVNTILQIDNRWIVIQSREHGLGRIPHFAFNWRSVDNSGYGMGIGRLVGADQRIEQGVINHALNLLAYQFNPGILYALGSGNAPTGDRLIRAGGFYGVNPIGDDVRKSVAVMEMPQVPGEAWQMIQYSKQSSAETSGADSTFMQGNLGSAGSSAARSAAGVNRISAKSDGRVQTPVENVETGFVVPFIHMLMNMVRMYMPLVEIREILSDKLDAAVLETIQWDSFMEAELEAEVLAGAKLAAKAAMAQQLPYLMQIFQQPQLLEQLHNEGKTVDLQVILDVLFAVSEYRMEDEIIRPMSDDEKAHQAQMMEAANGGGAKGQLELQKEQLRGQSEQQIEHLRQQGTLMNTIVQKALERNGEGLALAHAQGLVDRGNDVKLLQGQMPSPLAGV